MSRAYEGTSTLKDNEYEACPFCDAEVSHLAPDGLSFCDDCEKIVEGSTIVRTNEDLVPLAQMKYIVKPNDNDATPEWKDNPEIVSNLAKARKKRKEIADGMGLPVSAIQIWNLDTGERVVQVKTC